MKLQHLDVDQALASLYSDRNGLRGEEAARRLREFGPNTLETFKPPPIWRGIARQLTHFFALILWLAALLAFFAEHNDPGQGMAILGWAIIGVIVINGAFSFWQEYRAERTAAALRRLLPLRVRVLRDGVTHEILAQDLVPGDVILLQEGDRVPADCRLIEALDVRVNCATVTGESAPQARNVHPTTTDDIIHSTNLLLAGTVLVTGQARAVVFATGVHAEFGRIARLTETTTKERSPLQREIIKLSRLVALLALTIGLLFFLIGQLIGTPFWQNFIFAIGIIVALVPEGLLPTFTLALALGSQRMARKKALIRHLPSVETLGSTNVICTDKTGTLTQNHMTLRAAWLAGKLHIRDSDDLSTTGAARLPFLNTLVFCHDLKRGEAGRWLGDPMEIALVEAAEGWLGNLPQWPRTAEIPFDASRLRQSVVHTTPSGPMLYLKGAPEAVLPLCTTIQLASGTQPLDQNWRERLLAAQHDMASRGLRLLALACRPLDTGTARQDSETGLTLLGLVGLEDPPRPEVPEAIRRCRAAGIKLIMVTGDYPDTAVAIGREIGMVTEHPHVITGEQLQRMSHSQLQLALNARELIFARLKPDQKMRIVQTLQGKGRIVAVTGDGVNDAPALKQADIGIAMGISGTDVAREAADMVLLDDNFATIVNAIEEGRGVFENMRKFLTYILSHNIAELVPYLAFALFKIPLPLTVIQILAIDLGTDLLPGLALGAEQPRRDIMDEPPRRTWQHLADVNLYLRAFLVLGLWEAFAGLAAYFFVLHQGDWTYGQALSTDTLLYRQATTACLAAIVVMQIMNIFVCRSDRRSVFSRTYAANPLIRWGIGVEISLLLAITYTPWGNLVFGTAPLALQHWLFILPFTLGLLALDETRKAWRRRHGRHTRNVL